MKKNTPIMESSGEKVPIPYHAPNSGLNAGEYEFTTHFTDFDAALPDICRETVEASDPNALNGDYMDPRICAEIRLETDSLRLQLIEHWEDIKRLHTQVHQGDLIKEQDKLEDYYKELARVREELELLTQIMERGTVYEELRKR